MDEIKTILSKKLVKNDINIVNKILDFLTCENCKSLEIYKYWNQVDTIDWYENEGDWSDNILDYYDIHMGYCEKCYINLPICSCREKRHYINKCSNCKESICDFSCGDDIIFCNCGSVYCHSDCLDYCDCYKCGGFCCQNCKKIDDKFICDFC